MLSIRRSTLSVAALLLFAACGAAQIGADDRGLFGQREEPKPKNLRENLAKIQIDKAKKDYEQMISRGEEAVAIAEEVEKAYTASGSLQPDDLEKVAKVEKLVKKIRDELGGDGDDDGSTDADDPMPAPSNTGNAVEALRSRAASLLDQLKQTTRFTVSAAAIYGSNAVLKVTKFLKLRN